MADAGDRLFVTNFKLFWPDHLPPIKAPAWLVGWTSSTSAACVAGTASLTRSLEPELLTGGEDGSGPALIGVCYPAASRQVCSLRRTNEARLKTVSNIWVSVVVDSTGYIPAVAEIDFRNSLHFVQGRYVVYYSRPAQRSLQYYSTHPLVLDLSLVDGTRDPAPPRSAKAAAIDALIRPKMSRHSNPIHADVANPPTEDIEWILGKINDSAMANRFSDQTSSGQRQRSRSKPKPGSIKARARAALWMLTLNLILRPAAFAAFALRAAAETILWLVNVDISLLRSSLSKHSTAVHQVDLRLQQLCFWPWQYVLWHCSDTKLSAKAQAQYIGFFNTVWLIANDIIIGLAVGSMIIDYRFAIATFITTVLQTYTIQFIDSMVTWLMGWPAGLKLNGELNSFLGELFGWLIVSWSDIFSATAVYLPDILFVIGQSGMLGATMTLSMLSDLLMLATLHLQLFYTISAKIYFWQVTVIQSLFTLFRGKKRNALRNRVDSAEYDLDQLLLGTCFFTLLVFLLPTVAVYYLLFSFSRVAVVFLHTSFEIILAILNHFPLFAVMLRFKDPRRLPEGIQFSPCTELAAVRTGLSAWLWGRAQLGVPVGKMEAPTNTYVQMTGVPIGFSAIFYQYRFLYERLAQYYLSSQALSSFFTGENIEKIPHLQYPTMPARTQQKPNMQALWTGMQQALQYIT
ncbi:N-acetylglucosaminyl transferase component-domain-containing protein [Entophlyctis helioformis]|nr:N-acetylglucosaminyl transferase component-domain-containing protein [Entophlyctis helioformis]